VRNIVSRIKDSLSVRVYEVLSEKSSLW